MTRSYTIISALLTANVLASGLAAASVPSCKSPEPFSASYTSTLDKLVSLTGDGYQQLERLDGRRYRFTFDVTSSIADMTQSTVFEWDPENCRIVTEGYKHSIEGLLIPDRVTEFAVDPDSNMASGRYKGDPFSLKSKDRYVDPLSLQIQMRQDLRQGKHAMRYYMIHKGRVLIDKYQVVSEEVITISGTDYKTVKVKKIRPDTSSRETFLWMAPDLDYALVKMLHEEPDKERYEVVIDHYESVLPK